MSFLPTEADDTYDSDDSASDDEGTWHISLCKLYTYQLKSFFLQVLIYNQLLTNKIPLPCFALQIHRHTVTDRNDLTGNPFLEHKWNAKGTPNNATCNERMVGLNFWWTAKDCIS